MTVASYKDTEKYQVLSNKYQVSGIRIEMLESGYKNQDTKERMRFGK